VVDQQTSLFLFLFSTRSSLCNRLTYLLTCESLLVNTLFAHHGVLPRRVESHFRRTLPFDCPKQVSRRGAPLFLSPLVEFGRLPHLYSRMVQFEFSWQLIFFKIFDCKDGSAAVLVPPPHSTTPRYFPSLISSNFFSFPPPLFFL